MKNGEGHETETRATQALIFQQWKASHQRHDRHESEPEWGLVLVVFGVPTSAGLDEPKDIIIAVIRS